MAVDRAGFDHLYAWDHFYAIVGDQENPNLECTQVLGGWAAATERVKLGSLVHGITYRNPAVLVKTITALDHLSNGRAIMGIGAAWMEPEHEAERVSVIGQVLHVSDPERSLAAIPVVLFQGRRILATTQTNQFGEFQLQCEMQRRLELLVVLPESEIAIPLVEPAREVSGASSYLIEHGRLRNPSTKGKDKS